MTQRGRETTSVNRADLHIGLLPILDFENCEK